LPLCLQLKATMSDCMPRYHFNIHDGVDIRDDTGTELPNPRAAQIEAIAYAGALLRDSAKSIRLGADWHVEVTDHSGLILLRLDFHITGRAAAPNEGP
jgi:hypothetical protein